VVVVFQAGVPLGVEMKGDLEDGVLIREAG